MSGRHPARIGAFGPALVAIVLFASVGCASDFFTGERPCFEQADCFGEEQCILGTCTTVPDFEVDVEIEPTSVSGYLPFPIRAVDLGSPAALELLVPRPVTVRGEVQLASTPYVGSARISFSPEPSFRRSLRRTVDVTAEDHGNAAFEVRLVGTMLDRGFEEAIPYSVGLRPIEVTDCCDPAGAETCPAPRVITGVRFPSDQDDIVLGFPDRPTRILGRIVGGPDSAPLPRAGLQVQAFGESPQHHSLPAVTDELGQFCVALGLPEEDGLAAVSLHVAPPPGSDEIAPTLTFGLEIEPGGIHRDVELHVGAVAEPRAVSGRLLDRRGAPVEGVSVSFQGEVDGGGSLGRVTVSDGDGAFATQLLPGTYHVRAVPPRDSRAGTLEVEAFVVEAGVLESGPRAFERTLPDRSILSGRVVAPGDERQPVADLDVIADRVGSAVTDTSGRHRRLTTETDDHGEFVLDLDPGEYRLLFRPAPHTELPWVVGPTVRVDPDSHRDIGTVVLETAASFDGKALGKAGGGQTVPLSGAKVEVHARRHDATFLLWEGRAEEDGTFRVVLPTSLIGKVEASGPRETAETDR